MFSNEHVYARTLTSYPGLHSAPGAAAVPTCVHHVLVDGYEPEPEQQHSSSAEIARIVELVFEHARRRPNESLGVIAIGVRHCRRIYQAIGAALDHAPDAASILAFLDGAEHRFLLRDTDGALGERFDAVIVSLGFAKDSYGSLSYDFGPLNRKGGERLLNSAINRARKDLTIVSSFRSEDIDLSRSDSYAIEFLKRLLHYAEAGGEVTPPAGASMALDPFHADVHAWLRSLSVPVVLQPGSAQAPVDLAIPHPSRPGVWGIAILSDGHGYASAATVRDRERLRPEHLQRLGWQVIQLCSVDWYRDPQRAAEHIRDQWLALH